MSLEERIARIEKLLERRGLSKETGQDEGTDDERENGDGLNLGEWLQSHRRAGESIVVVGSARDGGIGTCTQRWTTKDPTSGPKTDHKEVSQIAQALANEARLHILETLLQGERSTSELLDLTGIEKGPLYHHLRELFVARLVEQRGRGRYALTPRGEMVFLVARTLPGCGWAPDPGAWSETDFGDDGD